MDGERGSSAPGENAHLEEAQREYETVTAELRAERTNSPTDPGARLASARRQIVLADRAQLALGLFWEGDFTEHHRDRLLEHHRNQSDAAREEVRRLLTERDRAEDHALVREQMESQRQAAKATLELAQAANDQTAALAKWTRVLAWATVALIAATVVSALIARG